MRGAHLQLLGERERVMVVAFSVLRGIAAGGDLAEEAEGPRLVAALTALAGKGQGSPGAFESVLEPVGEDVRSAGFEVILRGGRVIDPAQGIDGVLDVGIRGGKVAAVAPALKTTARAKVLNVRGKLVLPGLIDTHAHIYEHVTGPFGLNADLVGIRSGVTTVVDQGGASALTFNGFRKFVAEPAATRVLSFISIYLAGGLMGHSHTGLYGPQGIDVGATVRAIEDNRDLVKGIKTHAEVGGYSRWGIDVLKLAKKASRRAHVPVYIHLGGMWPVVKESEPDPDSILDEVLPLLDAGDVLAHPFTRHPGAFVAGSGKIHPAPRSAGAPGSPLADPVPSG